MDKNFKYGGEIYLPIGNFEIDNSLWLTEAGKDILYADLEKKTFNNAL